MRVWEFEDSKERVIPSDLVREQDFILRIRRLHRLATPHHAINLVLSKIEGLAGKAAAIEAVQKQLQDFAKVTNGVYAEMSNGDVFIIWEETGDAAMLSSRVMSVLAEGHGAQDNGEVLLTYVMPQDYPALRERANHYIEVVREAIVSVKESPAYQALQSDAARGPLTTWSADQIDRLLRDIDMAAYCRSQPICRNVDGRWVEIAEEFYISFDDLRRDRFPKMDMIPPEHLFMVLCETLDRALLSVLTKDTARIDAATLHLNLAIVSTLGGDFTRFAQSLGLQQRARITFELHRSDLLQDFSRTLNALSMLKQEGFRTALDGVTPDMLDYVDLTAFNTDFIKIDASKAHGAAIQTAGFRDVFRKLPAERVILNHCDSSAAVTAGLALGITLFQGWVVDDALVAQGGA